MWSCIRLTPPPPPPPFLVHIHIQTFLQPCYAILTHTYYCWLQIHEDCSRDMLACTSLTEEGVEGIIPSSNSLVRGHLPIWLDAMLQAVELPACIANLHTGLTNMDRDTLTLKIRGEMHILQVKSALHNIIA